MDQGGEFTSEVVECLLRRLGITHLRTSAYHPQTDAKCERVHFSIHNMITKMIHDKHERWPDLLGAVALAYNATVHTTTGYSPHELFYSFAPSCPLDAIVSTPTSDPASNADEFALQTFERLQEATAFVREYTDKNMQRMKSYYESRVKPQTYEVGEKVLVYNPKKKRGKFAKWQISWLGPFVVGNKLNQTNFAVQKGKGKSVVVHIDRMRKLLSKANTENPNCLVNDTSPTSQSDQWRKASDAAIETSTHCTGTANCTDPETSRSLFHYTDSQSGQYTNVCVDRNSLSLRDHIPALSQSTDTTVAKTAARDNKPCPALTSRPQHACRRPACYLEQVQVRLTNQACTRCVSCRAANNNTAMAICSTESESDTCVSACRTLHGRRFAGCIRSEVNMPRSRILRREAESTDSDSESGSGFGTFPDLAVDMPTGRSDTPPAFPADADNHPSALPLSLLRRRVALIPRLRPYSPAPGEPDSRPLSCTFHPSTARCLHLPASDCLSPAHRSQDI